MLQECLLFFNYIIYLYKEVENYMIKKIFFDFDGVLTTDKTGSYTNSKYFSQKIGIDAQELLSKVKQFDEKIDAGKISIKDVWKSICKEAEVEFNPIWLQEAIINTPIDERMLEYARYLKNKYSVGIITDNSTERMNIIMEQNKGFNIFDTIIISEDVKCTKKGTKIFEVAIQRANVNAKECIFIDNKQQNVDSAKKAGFIGVYFDDEKRDYDNLFKIIDEIIKNN